MDTPKKHLAGQRAQLASGRFYRRIFRATGALLLAAAHMARWTPFPKTWEARWEGRSSGSIYLTNLSGPRW